MDVVPATSWTHHHHQHHQHRHQHHHQLHHRRGKQLFIFFFNRTWAKKQKHHTFFRAMLGFSLGWGCVVHQFQCDRFRSSYVYTWEGIILLLLLPCSLNIRRWILLYYGTLLDALQPGTPSVMSFVLREGFNNICIFRRLATSCAGVLTPRGFSLLFLWKHVGDIS